jgi:hypothetical protein
LQSAANRRDETIFVKETNPFWSNEPSAQSAGPRI